MPVRLWQVWGRQLALTVVSLLPDILLSKQEQDDAILNEGARPALIWLHAGLAVGIFVLGFVLQHCMRPYVFDFQNWIEKFLLICSAIIVLLAALYTLFDAKVCLSNASDQRLVAVCAVTHVQSRCIGWSEAPE
jgi:FtsH-binding integral membrane protein